MTTLGATAGDTVTMSMTLGDLAGTGALVVGMLLLVIVLPQRAERLERVARA
jgi:uncharacterized membrane-anchored protein